MNMNGLRALLLVAIVTAATGGAVTAQNTATASAEEYIIRSGDLLRVRVWPDPTLGGEFPVEISGNVYLPFLGEVKVAGMRLSELQSRLRAGYAQAIKEPVVSVTPVFPVAVFGGVQAPGVYATEPTHRLMDVIARAGGLSDRAIQDQIRIVRQGRVIDFNAREALETGSEPALVLQSGDRIVVPTRASRNVWPTLLAAMQVVGFVITLGAALSN